MCRVGQRRWVRGGWNIWFVAGSGWGSWRVVWRPAAAAAAKLLQSCPTLWNSIDGSPPGSSVPGILQARIMSLNFSCRPCGIWHFSPCSSPFPLVYLNTLWTILGHFSLPLLLLLLSLQSCLILCGSIDGLPTLLQNYQHFGPTWFSISRPFS